MDLVELYCCSKKKEKFECGSQYPNSTTYARGGTVTLTFGRGLYCSVISPFSLFSGNSREMFWNANDQPVGQIKIFCSFKDILGRLYQTLKVF